MAVRAVIKQGAVQPTDPLPDEWRDGQEVSISAVDNLTSDEDVVRWEAECDRLASPIDAEDADRIARAIQEHRAEAKIAMRREMGLA